MKIKTFQLKTHRGNLIISPEIQDYLTHCSDNIKISLTIESSEFNDDLGLNSDDSDRTQTIKKSFQENLLEIRQKRISGRPTISEEAVY